MSGLGGVEGVMYVRMRPWLFAIGLLAGACYADERQTEIYAQLQRQAVGVDLDQPGAMEQLKRQNPRHFTKVEQILREAPKQSVSSVAGWMRTNFDAKDVKTSPLLRTSYPAQTRVSFVLDNTRYSKVIYIDAPARPKPAR
jgi:hypothetical protein